MDTRRLSSCIALGLALACAGGAAAAPYKWVDKDGNVHYSDKPPPSGVKAEQVELKPLTEVNSPPPAASSDAAAPAAPEEQAASGSYTAMRITSPADQATLRDPSAAINIGVALEPALMDGDRIEYTLDGKVVASPIAGLERGTHRIGARVLSENGGEKIAAAEVTVYLHQTSVAPVVPTKPKPAPKKTP